MKWDATEPQDNNYTFGGADQIVAFAQANNQHVHGHTLVWHSQTPGWVQGLRPPRCAPRCRTTSRRVVGRYANNPAVQSWDVVNEVFDENGSFRHSFWYNTLGSELHRRRVPLRPRRRPRRAAVHQRLQRRGHQRQEHRDVQPGPIAASARACRSTASASRRTWLCSTASRDSSAEHRTASPRSACRSASPSWTSASRCPPTRTRSPRRTATTRNVINALPGASPACAGVTIWGFTDKYSWVPGHLPRRGPGAHLRHQLQPEAGLHRGARRLGGGRQAADPPSTW